MHKQNKAPAAAGAGSPAATIVAALLALGPACVSSFDTARNQPSRPDTQEADELQRWLAGAAIPLRSLQAQDEDFDDLQPLARAIGAARVVQLGELSHGAGAHFAAKVRLVKFLHQRMGFDVLLWESGLYDLRLTEAALRAGEDPVAAARQGIFGLWSNSEEVRPLFHYARRSHASPRPLRMAGFDLQFSGAQSATKFAGELRASLEVLHDTAVRARALGLFDDALQAYATLEAPRQARAKKYQELRGTLPESELFAAIQAWEDRERHKLAPALQDYERFAGALRLLQALLADEQAVGLAHSRRSRDLMHQLLENYRVNGERIYLTEAADTPSSPGAARERSNASWNARDTRNAHLLRWLIDEHYAGHKIMVWAHNGHIMNAHYAADWRSLHAEPQPGGMTPSAVFLDEWLGEDVYSIGMTGYAGEDRWSTGGQMVTVQPAEPGSIESRLHALGLPQAIVDLRALDGQPDHPMRQPQRMRIRGTGRPESMPDLTRVFDAILFVDRMLPATPIDPP